MASKTPRISRLVLLSGRWKNVVAASVLGVSPRDTRLGCRKPSSFVGKDVVRVLLGVSFHDIHEGEKDVGSDEGSEMLVVGGASVCAAFVLVSGNWSCHVRSCHVFVPGPGGSNVQQFKIKNTRTHEVNNIAPLDSRHLKACCGSGLFQSLARFIATCLALLSATHAHSVYPLRLERPRHVARAKWFPSAPSRPEHQVKTQAS